jgi:hypothetical protein
MVRELDLPLSFREPTGPIAMTGTWTWTSLPPLVSIAVTQSAPSSEFRQKIYLEESQRLDTSSSPSQRTPPFYQDTTRENPK